MLTEIEYCKIVSYLSLEDGQRVDSLSALSAVERKAFKRRAKKYCLIEGRLCQRMKNGFQFEYVHFHLEYR